MTSPRCFDDVITSTKAISHLTQFTTYNLKTNLQANLSPKYFFKNSKKLMMTSFFLVLVLVLNFADLGIEAKVETSRC